MRPTSFVPQELRLSSAQRAEDCRAMSTVFMSAEYASAESLPAPFNAAIDALEDLVSKVARRFHRAPSLTRRSVGAGLSAVRVLCAALVMQAALCFTAPPVTMPMGAVSSRGTMTMSLDRRQDERLRKAAGGGAASNMEKITDSMDRSFACMESHMVYYPNSLFGPPQFERNDPRGDGPKQTTVRVWSNGVQGKFKITLSSLSYPL